MYDKYPEDTEKGTEYTEHTQSTHIHNTRCTAAGIRLCCPQDRGKTKKGEIVQHDAAEQLSRCRARAYTHTHTHTHTHTLTPHLPLGGNLNTTAKAKERKRRYRTNKQTITQRTK